MTKVDPAKVLVALLCTILGASGNVVGVANVAGDSLVHREVRQPPRLYPEYVRLVGRLAYLWGYPMVELHARREASERFPEPGLFGKGVPVAPVNRLSMRVEPLDATERRIACPDENVVEGFAVLALDRQAVVVEVPDLGSRLWTYELGDERTNGFAELGSMYGTPPGFYLVVGPSFKGAPPEGITRVLRSPTNLAYVLPRVYTSGDASDRQRALRLASGIAVYPLSEFTRAPHSFDWERLPRYSEESPQTDGTRWLSPERFFDVLPAVLDELPPQAGEEALYATFKAVLDAAKLEPRVADTLRQTAEKADAELLDPLLEFHHFGIPLQNNWTTIDGGGFGTDYLTRAAVARSGPFAARPNETKVFFQDLDERGGRLNGRYRYTVTFARNALPAVRGFWTLSLYDERHFFAANPLDRYSLGSKSPELAYDSDGALTLYVQNEPVAPEHRSNWLPAPKGDFSLVLRAHWPEPKVLRSAWAPPAVVRLP
jgi:hypothetical protein